MNASRVDGVKAPQHRGTPRSHRYDHRRRRKKSRPRGRRPRSCGAGLRFVLWGRGDGVDEGALAARGDHKLSREPQTASRRPLQDQGRRVEPRSHATADRHRRPAWDRHSATTGSPISSKSSRTGKLPLPRRAGGTYLPVRNVLAEDFLYKGSPSSWEGGVSGGGGGGRRGEPGGVRRGRCADFLWRSSLAAL